MSNSNVIAWLDQTVRKLNESAEALGSTRAALVRSVNAMVFRAPAGDRVVQSVQKTAQSFQSMEQEFTLLATVSAREATRLRELDSRITRLLDGGPPTDPVALVEWTLFHADPEAWASNELPPTALPLSALQIVEDPFDASPGSSPGGVTTTGTYVLDLDSIRSAAAQLNRAKEACQLRQTAINGLLFSLSMGLVDPLRRRFDRSLRACTAGLERIAGRLHRQSVLLTTRSSAPGLVDAPFNPALAPIGTTPASWTPMGLEIGSLTEFTELFVSTAEQASMEMTLLVRSLPVVDGTLPPEWWKPIGYTDDIPAKPIWGDDIPAHLIPVLGSLLGSAPMSLQLGGPPLGAPEPGLGAPLPGGLPAPGGLPLPPTPPLPPIAAMADVVAPLVAVLGPASPLAGAVPSTEGLPAPEGVVPSWGAGGPLPDTPAPSPGDALADAAVGVRAAAAAVAAAGGVLHGHGSVKVGGVSDAGVFTRGQRGRERTASMPFSVLPPLASLPQNRKDEAESSEPLPVPDVSVPVDEPSVDVLENAQPLPLPDEAVTVDDPSGLGPLGSGELFPVTPGAPDEPAGAPVSGPDLGPLGSGELFPVAPDEPGATQVPGTGLLDVAIGVVPDVSHPTDVASSDRGAVTGPSIGTLGGGGVGIEGDDLASGTLVAGAAASGGLVIGKKRARTRITDWASYVTKKGVLSSPQGDRE